MKKTFNKIGNVIRIAFITLMVLGFVWGYVANMFDTSGHSMSQGEWEYRQDQNR